MSLNVPTWRFHPARDRLIAEAHARPSTPIAAPGLATRIVTLSGEAGLAADRAHMAALCAMLGAPQPGEGSRWCVLDAGGWILRWERHTEASTWSFYRGAVEPDPFSFNVTALDRAPRDWLAALPGEVLAAAHVALVRDAPQRTPFADADLIAADILHGAMRVMTDFRAGPDGFTQFIVVQGEENDVQAGRVVQQLFEIETYRLMALLAYPLALETMAKLSDLEHAVDAAALHVANEGGVEADRTLLARLAALAGEAEASSGATMFRFSAARAYYGIVEERLAQWHEASHAGKPTVREFMERRLAPAMRTCAAVSERQRDVINRIARTTQLLSTRVQVEAEKLNADLLASMDRRSLMQFRLQQTVEGVSVVAISYYLLGLVKIGFDAVKTLAPSVNATLLTGLSAPIVVYVVWRFLRRLREAVEKGR